MAVFVALYFCRPINFVAFLWRFELMLRSPFPFTPTIISCVTIGLENAGGVCAGQRRQQAGDRDPERCFEHQRLVS